MIPVLLLLLLVALDFGRVYLGYINLQQMARIAGNYAADHATAWDATPGARDADIREQYQVLVANDARAINCALPKNGSGEVEVQGPAFPSGFDLGDPAEVRISCTFPVITPIIAQIVGQEVLVGAAATFPVKDGVVANVPGGGTSGPIAKPTAEFDATPRSGFAPLDVTFVDQSLNAPTSWSWNFGAATPASATSEGPHTVRYDCVGDPGTTCTFSPSLAVSNAGGSATKTTATDYITVTVPPDEGPIAEFQATTPRSGTAPLTVSFEFLEVTTGVTYTAWEWDFTGDGATDRTGETTSYSFTAPGTYAVTLTVTDDTAAQSSQTKSGYVVVAEPVCTVPDFAGVKVSNAQARWTAAGFTTIVSKQPPANKGPADYKIQYQSLTGGTVDPQPDGCDSSITVGP